MATSNTDQISSTDDFISFLQRSCVHDLTQPLSVFTPPWPHDHALEIHFFKRLTGAYGGGQGANGQVLKWSGTTGTHLATEAIFHSAGRRVADIPSTQLGGPGVIVDISDCVTDYGIYTPEMIEERAQVKPGDVLVIHTGYSRFSWEKPESSEFGFLVRHPGPSLSFFRWVMEKELKWVGVDCGSFEHPMNTPIRFFHAGEYEKARAATINSLGTSWDQLFPMDEYYQTVHVELARCGTVFVESLGGVLPQLGTRRAWITADAIPMAETETAWARVLAYEPPTDVSLDDFLALMSRVRRHDLTSPLSVHTPQWLNYKPLSISNHKRVNAQEFGIGRNGSICEASIHLGTHMDGEVHFHSAGRAIGKMPLDYWYGPGVIADLSDVVSDLSVYTPSMIEERVDLRDGDILIIKTGYCRYGWGSADSDEFRYMIRHPGPSPDFGDWCKRRKIRWIGVDTVAADHPMNTIVRNWHPTTFAEADRKLRDQLGGSWDELYPIDHYYQDMHLNMFPFGIVHAENLAGELLSLPGGRYFIGASIPPAVEAETMWGRFFAWALTPVEGK